MSPVHKPAGAERATPAKRPSLNLLAVLVAGLFAAPPAFADLVGLDEDSTVLAVTGDGAYSAGFIYTPGSGSQAYLWNGATPVLLGGLDGYGDNQAQGVSDDAGVVAGISFGFDESFNYYSQAFKWTQAGGLVALDGLAEGESSQANAVSADGNVIVGKANLANGAAHAVRWTGNASTLQDLTTGSAGWKGGADANSNAQGVSADGAVVVGYGLDEDSLPKAFRWTSGGGMVSLGTLAGHTGSEAKGVSGDGSVVVGNSYTFLVFPGDTRAFRWTQAGGMQDLGVLAGATESRAYAVSGDGAVVVGSTNNADYSTVTAFRWNEADGMVSVADWLEANGISTAGSTLENAYDVSDDGNVIVGHGQINGTSQAYIARVGGETGGGGGGGGGGGIIGTSDFVQSLANAAGVFNNGASFTQIALFGAHHRALMDSGLPAGRCMWLTGDLGSNGRTDTRQALGEVGVCGDLGAFRLGVGLGLSGVKQDLALGGDGEYDGKHLLLEADTLLAPGLLGSLTAFYGGWDADIQRNYMNGAAVDSSRGSTDARAWSLRAKLDWLDAARLGAFSLSPYAAYTHSHSRVDGYTETGGGFPVTYGEQQHTARELRLGLSGKTRLNDAAELRLTAEAVHRFDGRGGAVTGSLAGGPAFNLAGTSIKQNWARLGGEIDWRLGATRLLSASLNLSSEGEDASVSGSLSYKVSF
ncbi:MAG: autotransporter domain-containing protein [Pseudomonadota bacterium]